MQLTIESDGLKLAGYLASPASKGSGAAPFGLVLCHGFPAGPDRAATSARTYPAFADRLAAETGWVVLTFNFRGTGASEGNFSLAGWLADVGAAVDQLLDEGVSGVWLAGSSTGGALAICHAARDRRIRGVASLSAPATFDVWAAHPRRFLEHARQMGAISDRSFPPDVDTWGREFSDIRPLDAVVRIPPRPLLIMHGTDDDNVPLQDARTLATAVDGKADLRLIHGAGHRLRQDPRAVAFLLGWMERQAAV